MKAKYSSSGFELFAGPRFEANILLFGSDWGDVR
jgi:hypothetical protein